MYAIELNNSKFLNVEYFLGPDVYKVVVSSRPSQYKTRQAAETDLVKAIDHIDMLIANMEKREASNKATVAKAQTRMNKITATLAELVELPYKDVVVRINALNKEHASLVSKVEINNTTYAREIARLKRIKEAQPTVVEIVSMTVAI